MFFRVEHLGPLHEAEIDLSKRLVVLTGPNNTGKTYLAVTLYGLARIELFQVDVAVSKLVDRVLSAAEQRLSGSDSGEAMRALSGELAAIAASSLSRWFAAPESLFEHARLALRDERPPHASRMEAWRNGSGARCMISGDEIALRLLRRDAGQEVDVPWVGIPEGERAAARLLAKFAAFSALRESLLGLSGREAVIFPTERVAVNEFAAELALARTKLVDDIVGGSLREADVKSRAGHFTLPVRDSLESALTLKAASAVTSDYGDLAHDLESSILGGTVELSEHGEVRFAPSGTPGLSLGLHLSASMVKSLAGLVFYFRHMASSGDLIVIDEPELNLHPDSQRKVTQILAKAIRRGFKIVMSTHSDYVIRELDHLIMLSKLSPEEARELEYDPAWALRPDELGVYLFEHGRARAVDVQETGFSVDTIDAEINHMQQTSQRFYAKLSR